MPPRDPRKVQLDFPVLTADLIDQLGLIGQLGLLDFNPTVNPVFIVGSRGLVIESQEVLYDSADVFDGSAVNPVVGATLWDTGQLPAGDYDVKFWIEGAITAGTNISVDILYRDAADAVSLATWRCAIVPNVANRLEATFAMTLAEDERFRGVFNVLFTGRCSCEALIKVRPVP